MRSLAGFRNIVVHGYEDVALGVVRDILPRNRSIMQRVRRGT